MWKDGGGRELRARVKSTGDLERGTDIRRPGERTPDIRVHLLHPSVFTQRTGRGEREGDAERRKEEEEVEGQKTERTREGGREGGLAGAETKTAI